MIPLYEMVHYWHEDQNGLIHVTNMLLGMEGQHHVHTKEGFARWKKMTGVGKNCMRLDATQCNCGLKPGQARSRGGRVIDIPEFL